MLPIGIVYFVTAVVGTVGESRRFIVAPLVAISASRLSEWTGVEEMLIAAPSRGEWMFETVFVRAIPAAAGNPVVDLVHASRARRRPAACHVREVAAGRTSSAIRAGGRRGTPGAARRALKRNTANAVGGSFAGSPSGEGVTAPPSA